MRGRTQDLPERKRVRFNVSGSGQTQGTASKEKPTRRKALGGVQSMIKRPTGLARYPCANHIEYFSRSYSIAKISGMMTSVIRFVSPARFLLSSSS